MKRYQRIVFLNTCPVCRQPVFGTKWRRGKWFHGECFGRLKRCARCGYPVVPGDDCPVCGPQAERSASIAEEQAA